jgi:integrase
MPKLKIDQNPSYRRHKASGQAVVSLNGRQFYLGKWNSPESRGNYQRLIAEWRARHCQAPAPKAADSDITVCEIIAAFRRYATNYYRATDGQPTGELDNFDAPLSILQRLYGPTVAVHFCPLALKAVREEMIARKWSRNYINRSIHRVRRVFKWAENEGLIKGVYQSLRTVELLQPGRSLAPESVQVEAVPDAVVDKTLPYLSSVVVGMVQFQRSTGCRPGEVVSMKVQEIDRGSDVWIYSPPRHKNAFRGHKRKIFIGPAGQKILAPFLMKLDGNAFVFDPREAMQEMRQCRSSQRKTPLSFGNQPGSNISDSPKRQPGDGYSVASYRRSIWRACAIAFPPPPEIVSDPAKCDQWNREHRWHPNRLRHSFAGKARQAAGIDVTATLLGHASPDTTLIYAEKDEATAREIVRKIG